MEGLKVFFTNHDNISDILIESPSNCLKMDKCSNSASKIASVSIIYKEEEENPMTSWATSLIEAAHLESGSKETELFTLAEVSSKPSQEFVSKNKGILTGLKDSISYEMDMYGSNIRKSSRERKIPCAMDEFESFSIKEERIRKIPKEKTTISNKTFVFNHCDSNRKCKFGEMSKRKTN